MAVIATIEEVKKAVRQRAGIFGAVTTFRMISADGEDLEVVARTRRRGKDLNVLDIRNALLAAWRRVKLGPPPAGWAFVLDGVAGA